MLNSWVYCGYDTLLCTGDNLVYTMYLIFIKDYLCVVICYLFKCLFINMYAYNLFSRFSRYKTVMHLVCDFGMIFLHFNNVHIAIP